MLKPRVRKLAVIVQIHSYISFGDAPLGEDWVQPDVLLFKLTIYLLGYPFFLFEFWEKKDYEKLRISQKIHQIIKFLVFSLGAMEV